MRRGIMASLLACALVGFFAIVNVSAYTASNYGFNCGSFTTYGDADTARSEQSSIGYSATSYRDSSISSAYNRLRSDNIFFMSGHGAAGHIVFTDGWLYANDNGQPTTDIGSLPTSDLHDIALAVFSACESAKDSTYSTMIQICYDRGVDCALGWTTTIEASKASTWNSKFWEKLDDQWDVYNAAGEANNAVFWTYYSYGGTNNWATRGNTGLKIDPQTGGN
jgi:hypothetical protein